ncbi:MAG: hypothetical protein FWJ93_01595 [Micromonosporaceae bacterium]|uniref:Uncharacterized protein n=1 Tax=Thermocrispum agreste TaxID=37925 RepID=A0A2W4L3G3_9PSEU|nr:MAG: hypothetical protein DIU77_16650 [Thermocrispum agreste]
MKAHRTDGLSLTFGLIFLAIVAWWLVAEFIDLSLPNAGWFVAGTLILLGLLGLVGALRPTRPAETDHGPNRGTEPFSKEPTSDEPVIDKPAIDEPTSGSLPAAGDGPTEDRTEP